MRLARKWMILVPVCALGCALFAYVLCAAPLFCGADSYELYYGTSSAHIRISHDPVRDKLLLPDVKGECARYAGNRYEELKERFSARLVFEEEVGDTHSYYLYSPRLAGGVLLREGRVNLHIAVRGERTAVGTPLIFGGF